MSNSSIWPIDRNLSGATNPGLSELGNNSNKDVLRIIQSFSTTGGSPSDCLMAVGVFYSPNQLSQLHHHHHVAPSARISLTLSRHFSQSFLDSDRFSELHSVSSHRCCMYVRAGRPAFARPYAGVNRSTSLMSSALLLQQCPACLVCLTWIVFVMGGRWPYSWCLVGCCRQDLFNIASNILV